MTSPATTGADVGTAEPFLVTTGQAVVEVTGEERADYLEDVTTQHLTDMEPGEVRGALHLEVKGAPVAMFDVIALESRLLLLLPDEETAEEAVGSLGSRTFLRDASFAPTGREVRALRGGGAAEIAEATGLGVLGVVDRPGRAVVGDDDELVVVGRGGGLDLLGPAEALDAVTEALREAGARPGGEEDLEAWRIGAGNPSWGREVSAPHLPEEMGIMPTHVHLDKGCYPGQEAIARMWMLGQPRRRLARVRLRPGVEAGAELGSGRGKVRVTSVAPAPEGADGEERDEVEALAYVPPDTEPGAQLEPGDVVVEVLEIVGADDPVPGADAAGPRRRDTRD